MWKLIAPVSSKWRHHSSWMDVSERGVNGWMRRWWITLLNMEEWVNIHPFSPSSSVDVSAPAVVLAAARASGEPAHSSEVSILSAGAAGALGGRVGWRYWPGGGQRRHHCHGRGGLAARRVDMR